MDDKLEQERHERNDRLSQQIFENENIIYQIARNSGNLNSQLNLRNVNQTSNQSGRGELYQQLLRNTYHEIVKYVDEKMIDQLIEFVKVPNCYILTSSNQDSDDILFLFYSNDVFVFVLYDSQRIPHTNILTDIQAKYKLKEITQQNDVRLYMNHLSINLETIDIFNKWKELSTSYHLTEDIGPMMAGIYTSFTLNLLDINKKTVKDEMKEQMRDYIF